MKAVNYDIDIVIASQEELRCFSDNINLNYSRYACLSATKETVDIKGGGRQSIEVGTNQSTRKNFYSKKMNPMEDS